jgi:membrane-associated protease RseP (regulator of RpoE activity)
MNLLLAFVFLGVVVAGVGVPTTVPVVSSVSRCITPADQAQRACTTSDPVAPAATAGFQPGDEIVRYAGRPVTRWADVQTQIRANRGTPVEIVVRRAGREVPLTVTPAVAQRPKLDQNGEPVLGVDGKPELTSVGFLGVLPTRELQRQSLAVVPGMVGNAVKQTAAVVLVIPSKMVGVVQSVLSGSERDPNGPISLVGIGRIAGESASADAGAAGVAAPTVADRLAGPLSLIATLNVALFVFNMIPLLPLDGGHVAGALWEGVRRGVARLRRRPDPGPVDIARALPLAYGVASVLIGMSVLLIYADIVNPVRLG